MAIGEEFAETAAPGWALCHTVSACADVGDFERAEQWCRALHTWSADWQARHFFGICRTAYGEVLATNGDWSTAEQELVSAWDDLRATRPALAAPTAVRLGRLRMRQGDLTRARSLFEAALPLPQAILALGDMDLDGGSPEAAVDAADRVLRRLEDASILDRFPALELLARASAVAGDGPRADTAANQLERDAARLATPYMRGRARLLRARVLSAAGDHDGARRAAEDAADLFAGCSAPYETAEARLLLSTALEALDRPERAEAEARSARAAFALLNADTGETPTPGRPGTHSAGGRRPSPGRAGTGRHPDRPETVLESAHGSPAHREHPDQARSAVACGCRRPRHQRRSALAAPAGTGPFRPSREDGPFR